MIVGIGIDRIEIQRVADVLARHPGRAAERLFTSSERAACEQRADSAQCYAARFAAKEAVLKVLGTGWRSGISWHDIEVRRSPSGQPMLRLSGRCAQLAREIGVREWRVSLSHTDRVAVASVIGCG